MKLIIRYLLAVLVVLGVYLAFWPVPVRPALWQAPENPGYAGTYAQNDRLAGLALIDLGDHSGPEDADIGPDGLIYVTTHDGVILRIDAEGRATKFARTGGRPLGIEFGPDGTLFVADAFRGLLAIDHAGRVTLLADKTEDGSPIRYANDLDIAADGVVYFSDASTRFGARQNGGTLAASILDLVEHSANGRVLRYDPATGRTTRFSDGFTFANGVALNEPEDALFVVETGEYRLWRFALDGGAGEVVLDNLPGFPDNINRAPDGTFWLGLVSPRNALMDALSGYPFWRSVIMRLPEQVKPAPTRYGFVLHLDAAGQVIETLQDPTGSYALVTGAMPHPDGGLVVTSLTEPKLGLLPAP